MRLFVAVELPPEHKAKLVALRRDIPGATWVKDPALHLTLRFLGDQIDAIRLTPIRTALGAIKAASFALTLRGTGRFPPNPKRPARVLWVGIAEQSALMGLQMAVEQALAEVGFEPEERPFSPHITLARFKGDGPNSRLDHFLEQHGDFSAEPFTVNAFYLVASTLKPDGPVYRHEGSFPLREPSG